MAGRSSLALFLAALLANSGCTAAPSADGPIEVDGSIRYYDLEGGFWAIAGDDGVTYDPSPAFTPDYCKEGLRVHAVLDILEEVGGYHMAGPIVKVLRLDLAACAPAPCPLPVPPVRVWVMAWFDGQPVPGAQWSGVVGPVGGGDVLAECALAFDPERGETRTLCTLRGGGPGSYQGDIGAPGYQPQHVSFEILARSPLPGECCPVGYVPDLQAWALMPSP